MNKDILKAAGEQKDAMIGFLRDIVAIPSTSGNEEAVVKRIALEMEKVGFDEVKIDPLGNIMGRVGSGPRVIAMDAHIDTVDVTDHDQWECDPFTGKLEGGKVYGRGSVDQKAGMAGMVYAGKLIKDMDLANEFQVWMVGSVMEEDCDGLCWHYILEEGGLKPELVISTEPTNLRVTRGQRGRMEIRVATRGVSCHGSAPERGDNAVYKLAPAFKAIEALHERLADDAFLGKGSCTVTWMGSQSPSLCAVPDGAELHIDRRLTVGETRDSALREVEDAIKDAGVDGKVFTLTYEVPSWTGLTYPMDKYYPTWVMPEDHASVQAGAAAFRSLFGNDPEITCWTFSTNGVTIKGLHDVPCIGFGPGEERLAHAPNEYVPADDVVKACAFYAAFPGFYKAKTAEQES
jgi:putative selenium metabolism hydrolase